LGTKFSQAYKIKYQTPTQQEYAHQTCHAISTRLLALTISTHGDRKGLITPPEFAPTQIILIPIYMKGHQDDPITEMITQTRATLKKQGFRIECDLSSKRPGDKYYKYELEGVPIRMEIGPNDVKNNTTRVVRRDTGVKCSVNVADLVTTVHEIMNDMYTNLVERAKTKFMEHVHVANSQEELVKLIQEKGGLIKIPLYDPYQDQTCQMTNSEKLEHGNALEQKIFEMTNGAEIRGYDPTEICSENLNCLLSNRVANTLAFIAKQ
jgi:prolyl-tRNA synthetase